MKWKSRFTKKGKETYRVSFDDTRVEIIKDIDCNAYWICIEYEFSDIVNSVWANGLEDIKVKLARRKIPQEIINSLELKKV